MENQSSLQQENKELEAKLAEKKVVLRHESGGKNIAVPIAIVIAGVLIAGAVLFSGGKGTKTPNVPPALPDAAQAGVPVAISADDDAFLGKADAPVTLIEFSDFECPFCRKFWKETLSLIKKEYIDTGKARLVYRDFPLSFHPGAAPAAEGTECAREQGKFWELHDKIFEEQEKQGQGTIQFTGADVKKWAAQIGLDAGRFNQCLDSGKYKQEVEKDIADGSAAGVTGTPAVFVNGRLITGAQPFSVFKAVIDEELKKLGK